MIFNVALCIDIFILNISLWCVLRVSERSIFNPSLWWIGFHAYSVTLRLISLSRGSRPLDYMGISSNMELVRAAIAADISLLAIMAATVFAAYVVKDNVGCSPATVRLNLHLGLIISILSIIVGTYSIFTYSGAALVANAYGADVTAINIGEFQTSSYPYIVGGFAVQGALILCAMCGFTRWLVVLLAILLFLTSISNSRTFFVLPLIMAFLILQTRRRKRSMPVSWMIGFLLLGVVWFVYKPVVGVILSGGDAKDVWTNAKGYFQDKVSDDSSLDMQFLDMQATYMAAADDAGRRYYGATILPLLTLPIPRFLWPDKPNVNMYSEELSTGARQIAVTGMTPNLSGESYLNFGWLGCALIPFMYVCGMQLAFLRVERDRINSSSRWIYMVLLISRWIKFITYLSNHISFAFDRVGHIKQTYTDIRDYKRATR